VISDALHRLTKHSAIYALGPLAQKAIGFLLLPFVTAWIGTSANYGVVEMSAVVIAFASQLLGINLLHGMTRFYAEYDTEAERGKVVTTAFWLLAGTTGLALLAAVVFRRTGAEFLFGSSLYSDALVLVAAILMLSTIGQVGLRWLQVLHRSIAYGVLTTTKTVLEVGFKVWLMAGLGLAYTGALGSVLGGEAVVAAGMIVWMGRKIGLGFSRPIAKRLVRYSYPLILGGIPMFALHQADRWFVRVYWGMDGVGQYSLAYKLGTIANAVLLESFGLVWFPYVFGLKDPAAVRSVCRAVMTYFTAAMACASLVLAVFSPEIVRWMADPKFYESHRAMPLVVAGYLFWAVYQVASTAFYLRQKTGTVSLLVGFAAVANLALNLLLVPRMGYLGAAWATLLTFGGLALVSWFLAERALRIGYEVARVLVPIVSAAALYAASLRVPGGASWAGLTARAALVLALPVLLWSSGYLREEEKTELLAVARSLASPLRRR
jgi:O-antigen/teichoic acid export membrane protein